MKRLIAALVLSGMINGCDNGSGTNTAPMQPQATDATPTYPEPPFIVAGEVVKIADGGTLTLLVPEERHIKIRLAEIGTPEKDQPYYQQAKQALADKVFRQAVQVEIVDWDRNGAGVGKVSVDGEYVNAWMVAEGYARVYRKYSDNPGLLELEAAAKEAERGIWALSEAERAPRK
jgi:micrococcal nuclease